MPKTIRQSVTFAASPHDVYEALMASRKRARFPKRSARISRRVGGKLTAYGGYIDGVNWALEPSRKIVQAWRGSEWPKGGATFAFRKVKTGTRLSFTQSGVPDHHYAHIKRGGSITTGRR